MIGLEAFSPAEDLLPEAKWVAQIASEVAGKVVTSGIEASMRSSERQRELDNRILPGIPSDVQGIYLAFFLLGVIGWPVSGGWWSRIWPAETRESYGNLFGYWAAQAVRGVLFAAVFMPAVAVASAPIALAHNGWRSLAKVLALLTWPFRRAGAKG